MRINIDKTRVINFTRKTNSINYNYVLCDKCVIRTDSIEDLGVLIVSKLFRRHVGYIYSQPLGLVRRLTYSFCTVDSLPVSVAARSKA
jgi:hypothetical protein